MVVQCYYVTNYYLINSYLGGHGEFMHFLTVGNGFRLFSEQKKSGNVLSGNSLSLQWT